MGDNAGDATATEKHNGESHRYYSSRKTLLLMLKDRGYNISDSNINLTFTQFRDRHWTSTFVDRFQISASHLTDSNNKVLAVFCDTGVVRLDTIRFMSNRIRIYNKESLSRLIIAVQSRITTPAMKAIADCFACEVEIFQMTDLLVDYTTKHELKPSHVVVPDKVKEKEKQKLVFKVNLDALKANLDALKANLDAKQGLQAPAPVVKGVEKSCESPGGHLEKTFGDSVTTVADKSKRKIDSSEIKSPDSKRNKLMAMFNQNRKGTDVSKKVIERPVTEMEPVTHVEKLVEVAALKPVVQTGDKQGSKSGDAVVGSSTVVSKVQEQTNNDISNAVTTALATLASHCPEICQRLELHEKQSSQVMAEKRKAEAEVERLEKLVADLKQSCSAETLLRMKTESELSEMKKKFITDQEKHAMSFHEKDMALNEAHEEIKEKGKLLRELTEKTEALTKEVTRLREDRRWLIAEGIPRSFEVIRSSEEYMGALTELTTAADLVGRLDGMVDGFKLCKGGGRVKYHHNYRKDARDELANAFEAFSDMESPILNKLTATAESDDLSDLKALLASPGRDDID